MPETRDPRGFSSEIKFLVDPAVAQRVREWARQHLKADPNGGGPYADEYRVTSLYFDTRGFDVFHRRGSFGRAKYRVRRYGELPILFLERKLKRDAFLHKRRTIIPIERLPMLDRAAAPPTAWDGTWFRRRLLARNLEPVCEIAYLRTARTGVAEGRPIRVTIDADVVAAPADDLRVSRSASVPVLPSLSR
jgi:SPX domain protein involved in polyphosphate accumulation